MYCIMRASVTSVYQHYDKAMKLHYQSHNVNTHRNLHYCLNHMLYIQQLNKETHTHIKSITFKEQCIYIHGDDEYEPNHFLTTTYLLYPGEVRGVQSVVQWSGPDGSDHTV